MSEIRIATFNCENLFARYRFRENFTPTFNGFQINDLAFDIHDETAKRITAEAIRDVDADIICLQEVENMSVLERFNSRYMPREGYRHRIVVDGNDPRLIDVAVLSRHPFRAVRSARHIRNAANTAYLFSRDCLRVDVDCGGRVLTLYVNHLKSMIGGRADTRPRRQEQAEGVHAIIREDWGAELEGDFAVVGDMNDYPGEGTALGALLDEPNLVNPVDRLPEADRWTHFWAGGGEYRQLDYILLSRSLDARAGEPVPTRNLQGLPWRAERHAGERYDNVGENEPKASDHVPLAVTLRLG